MLPDMNWMLAEELDRIHRAELAAELAHERFLEAHGLDLWSIARRFVSDRVHRLGPPPRSVPLAVRSCPALASTGEGDGRQAA
jgi:hypothetical protein